MGEMGESELDTCLAKTSLLAKETKIFFRMQNTPYILTLLKPLYCWHAGQSQQSLLPYGTTASVEQNQQFTFTG